MKPRIHTDDPGLTWQDRAIALVILLMVLLVGLGIAAAVSHGDDGASCPPTPTPTPPPSAITLSSFSVSGARTWPPAGWIWTCFETQSGRVVKCMYLPPAVANRLPCSNCR